MKKLFKYILILFLIFVALAVWKPEYFVSAPVEPVFTIVVPESGNPNQEVGVYESAQGFSGSFDIVDEADGRGSVVTIESLRTNVDGSHAVVPFGVNYGGTGTFIYLGLFAYSETDGWMHLDSFALGDRVAVDSVRTRTPVGEEGNIVVEYRIYGTSQAFSEDPNEPAIASFVIDREQLLPRPIYDGSIN